jgi:hypothetical protein
LKEIDLLKRTKKEHSTEEIDEGRRMFSKGVMAAGFLGAVPFSSAIAGKTPNC